METRWGRPAGGLLRGLGVVMLVGQTGCAAILIAHTGTPESALYEPTTRAAVVERFGQPDKTESFPDGSAEDTYHLRKQLAASEPAASGSVSKGRSTPIGIGEAQLVAMYVMLTVATFGAPEVIAAGVVLGKSIHEAHRITFVSDPAGQIILRDLLTQPPAARFAAVQRQLRQRLLGEAQNEAAPLAPCVERYGRHLQRWAHRAEFPMPPETDDGLQLVTLLARDVDEGRLDRADVLLWLTTPSAYNPIP